MNIKVRPIQILASSLFPILVFLVLILVLLSHGIKPETITKLITVVSVSVIVSFSMLLLYYILLRDKEAKYETLVGFIGNLVFLILPIILEVSAFIIISIIFNSFFLFSSLMYLINVLTLKSQKVKVDKLKNFATQLVFLNPQIYKYVLIITLNTLLYQLNKDQTIPIVTLFSLLAVVILEEISRIFAIHELENKPYTGNNKLLNIIVSKYYTLIEKLSNTEKFVDALSLEIELNKAKQDEMKISLTRTLKNITLLKNSFTEKEEKIEQLENSLNNIIGEISTSILAIEYSISKLTNITDDSRNKIEDAVNEISKALSKKEEIQDYFSKIMPIFESLSVKIDSISDIVSNIVVAGAQINKIMLSISGEIDLLSVIATNTEIEASKMSKDSSLKRISANINEAVLTIKDLSTKITNLHKEISQFFDYLSPISDSIAKHSERIKLSISNLNSSTNNINKIISNVSQELINSLSYFDEIKNSIMSISQSMLTMRKLLEKTSEILNLTSEFKNMIKDSLNALDEINISIENIIRDEDIEKDKDHQGISL